MSRACSQGRPSHPRASMTKMGAASGTLQKACCCSASRLERAASPWSYVSDIVLAISLGVRDSLICLGYNLSVSRSLNMRSFLFGSQHGRAPVCCAHYTSTASVGIST
jgi:hypothetical protein